MEIHIHPHAAQRLMERGATESDVRETIRNGEPFTAKYDRRGFRRCFAGPVEWMGRIYHSRQVEVIAVAEGNAWVVVTVKVKYFGRQNGINL